VALRAWTATLRLTGHNQIIDGSAMSLESIHIPMNQIPGRAPSGVTPSQNSASVYAKPLLFSSPSRHCSQTLSVIISSPRLPLISTTIDPSLGYKTTRTMYVIRTSFCPHCNTYEEFHDYDNDQPIAERDDRLCEFTYRGPALIQEVQTVIQYCDVCAQDPSASRYLKLGIPLDKFLEYCNDEEYAKYLEKTITRVRDEFKTEAEKGEIINMVDIERDDEHFLQTMVTLQADGKRMFMGEDLGRRKHKGEKVKKWQRWLSGIGRGRQQKTARVPDTTPSSSEEQGRKPCLDEKMFWIDVPDRDSINDEDDAVDAEATKMERSRPR